MDVMEIIKESLTYPLNNIGGMVLYTILGIIAALVFTFTVVSSAFASKGNFVGILLSIIGIVVSIILFLAIDGYGLDIIKLGIRRSDESPSIDLVNQATNGLKLLIIQFVYLLIPLIIYVVLLMFLATWFATLIFILLVIAFALAETMATCRLAETEDISVALSIGDCMNDVSRVGIFNILITVAALFILVLIITMIIMAIFGQTSAITSVLTAIVSIYFLFVGNRAIGLLYSNPY